MLQTVAMCSLGQTPDVMRELWCCIMRMELFGSCSGCCRTASVSNPIIAALHSTQRFRRCKYLGSDASGRITRIKRECQLFSLTKFSSQSSDHSGIGEHVRIFLCGMCEGRHLVSLIAGSSHVHGNPVLCFSRDPGVNPVKCMSGLSKASDGNLGKVCQIYHYLQHS